MRKWIVLVVASIVFVAVVLAATLTVTVPPGSATNNALLQCEVLRLQNRVLAANWSNDICASVMTREGVRRTTENTAETTRQSDLAACASTANNTFQNTMNQFESDWPLPTSVSSCGDSAVDTEFGEDCDDGGESATCNDNCTTSVCGDGERNATAGEQCDDGNTDPGDGCDATCQNE